LSGRAHVLTHKTFRCLKDGATHDVDTLIDARLVAAPTWPQDLDCWAAEMDAERSSRHD